MKVYVFNEKLNRFEEANQELSHEWKKFIEELNR